MFVGFNLDIGDELNGFKQVGNELFENFQKSVEKHLEVFLLKNGNIDGAKMRENWFPQINADVFVSHSHNDQDIAIGLAGMLYRAFGIRTFVDSCVWGYADVLLEHIDDQYCRNPSGNYSYRKRNLSTSHVHLMLSTALTMMIDKTECIIFLKTPDAISSSDIVNRTHSPWIYYEIAMTRLVRQRALKEYRPSISKKLEKSLTADKSLSVPIEHSLHLEHFYNLSRSDLANWLKDRDRYKTKYEALDYLYAIKGIIPKTL